MKCFRCGGPHKIAQCPERPRDSANVTILSKQRSSFSPSMLWMSRRPGSLWGPMIAVASRPHRSWRPERR